MGGATTAEQTTRPTAKRSATAWPVPPREGWTVDDLDTLPGLPPHTELIDGSLVLVSPQRRFHNRLKLAVPFSIDIDLTAIDEM